MITGFTIISVITSVCDTDAGASFSILWLLRKGCAQVPSSAFVESLKDPWPPNLQLDHSCTTKLQLSEEKKEESNRETGKCLLRSPFLRNH